MRQRGREHRRCLLTRRIPATICSRVLLPDPFSPMTECLSAFDLKGDIAKRPKILVKRDAIQGQKLFQPVFRRTVDGIALTNVLELNNIHGLGAQGRRCDFGNRSLSRNCTPEEGSLSNGGQGDRQRNKEVLLPVLRNERRRPAPNRLGVATELSSVTCRKSPERGCRMASSLRGVSPSEGWREEAVGTGERYFLAPI